MKRLGSALILACLLLVPAHQAAAEWTADVVDTEWFPKRSVAVDKKAQSFFLLTRQSPVRVADFIPCATGQLLGDKNKEGDLKTPEGVYFITRRKTGGLNFELYGDLAFPLNFPNPADLVRRKTGHGIWIHGRGHAIIPNETQGCVALNTPDLHRLDSELALGTPVIIADELRLEGDAPRLKAEAREVVDATQAWAKAWQDRSDAFFALHDAEKFAISEGQSFAAFRSQKERLFKSLPWIQVTLSDVRALPGPDYWVTFFVQVYRSPTLISQGVKRLYWQRGPDGRFRIIGMEYDEMPVTLAEKGKAKPAALANEAETATARPDEPSEEETQTRQLVDAHQAAMEKVAQKAFHSLPLARQPTPEDQAILEVAQTGAAKPGVSPFATDAAPAAPAPPQLPAVPGPQVAAAPAVPAAAPTRAPAPAASVAAPLQVAALPTQPAASAVVPGQSAKAAQPPQMVTAAPQPVSAEHAGEIKAVVESWRTAWEHGQLDAYLAHYADEAVQGNLKGKDAIRRQKSGLWQNNAPGRVHMDVLAVAPDGDGYAAVCAMRYQGKGAKESDGFKTLHLVPAGGKLLIAKERWSKNRPELAPSSLAAAASATPAALPVSAASAGPAVSPAVATQSPAQMTQATPGATVAAASVPAPVQKAEASPVLPAAPAVAAPGTPAAVPAALPVPAAPPAVATQATPAPQPALAAPRLTAETARTAKADGSAAVAAMLEAWRTAWERGRPSEYAAFYADTAIQGDRRGREAIRSQKVALWKDKAPRRVAFSEVKIAPRRDGYVVTFVQDYESRDGLADKGKKTLSLAPSGNGYAIVEEKWSRQ
ncbi:L,D-transpeptidase family protein [Desulfovibrio aerotolerans]|uniref:L,D-transpeptidase family protein n=1 Tax=Solidesulfovibrio aerotolerans TaxID=295255 RepID=A0A7C9IMW3_9BACT|nr:L,D-transpeptidase family protein [Solidesulfovibrio aerotolerans]MYL82739.1 L,D-transpeptidase family protein [Solidesulfovibrio aerotolerans]